MLASMCGDILTLIKENNSEFKNLKTEAEKMNLDITECLKDHSIECLKDSLH